MKLTKEACETIVLCATEFIHFITSQCVEKLKLDGRKTLLGSDLIEILRDFNFEMYVPILELCHEKYSMIKGATSLESESGQSIDLKRMLH